MNIIENKIDNLNIELTLNIEPADYADKRKKVLSDYRKKAEIKGFRKGMVPASLIEKMYGQSALMDAVNNVIGEQLDSYIKENNLDVLGEPLPAENQPQNTWENGASFTFQFEVALHPSVEVELSKEDKIAYYTIEASDEAKAEMKNNMLKQYGKLDEGEAAGSDDFIIVDLEQGETKIEGTYVALRNVAEEARNAQFIGLKAGDSIEVNVNEAFANETDRAAMLKVEKDQLASIEPIWKLTCKNIKTFVNAELCQETYDKIYGEGVVKSEEEFDAKIAENLAAEYVQEANYRFSKDAKEYLLAKAGVTLPEKFLKRWLVTVNEGKFTAEQIEKEFPAFCEDFKWQIVRDNIANKFDIKVTPEEAFETAKEQARYQYAMYGMNNVPEEYIQDFAMKVLSEDDGKRRIADMVLEKKLMDAVKEQVSLANETISVEKFRELK